jgi:hypothetical protein
MDTSAVGRGETIAGVSAVALLLIMFIFDWFGFGGTIDTGIGTVDIGGGFNAWQSFEFIDIILFLTIGAAIAVAAMAASGAGAGLPVAGSAIVTGLGGLSTILILYRILDTPGGSDREIGVFLGLIAAAGITYGGWTAMQEEGTSFGDQASGFGGGGGGGGDGPPPPPSA